MMMRSLHFFNSYTQRRHNLIYIFPGLSMKDIRGSQVQLAGSHSHACINSFLYLIFPDVAAAV